MIVWDVMDMNISKPPLEAPPKSGEITALGFLDSSCLFVTGHENGGVRLWNIELEKVIPLTKDDGKGHKNTITCISTAIHKQIEYLLTSGYDGRVNSWEISEKKQSTPSIFLVTNSNPSIHLFHRVRLYVLN
jgi:WD40 repeat protein